MEATFFGGISIWLIIKIFVLLFLAIYIVFGLVVVKQISLMEETLDAGFSFPIKAVGWAHLFFSIGVFVIALLIL